jgi:hypothetical protein
MQITTYGPGGFDPAHPTQNIVAQVPVPDTIPTTPHLDLSATILPR